MKMKSMFLAAFVLAFGACGEEEEENELVGTWSGTCEVDGDSSSLSFIEVDEDIFTVGVSIYTDAACATKVQTYRYQYGYTADGDIAFVENATSLDLVLAEVTAAPHTAEMVTAMNASSAFGQTDWTLDTAQGVIGFDYDGTVNEEVVGNTFYTIYNVDGSKLCFGASPSDSSSYTGETAATRVRVLGTGTDCFTK
ncbi:MAG: hypothetical protein AB8C84_02380 [Oligoflexales bacterium]